MKILLPVDGSELSRHEVDFAIELVRNGLQASFLVVNVQEPATLYELVTAPDAQTRENAAQAAGLHALEPALDQLRQAGITCEAAVVAGDPAHALVDLIEAEGLDMVVIGTRGMGALASAFKGSVAQSMLHQAPVPVLLVKEPPEPPSALPEE
jgi:nucleotide-binding universal stress UspA family protein